MPVACLLESLTENMITCKSSRYRMILLTANRKVDLIQFLQLLIVKIETGRYKNVLKEEAKILQRMQLLQHW